MPEYQNFEISKEQNGEEYKNLFLEEGVLFGEVGPIGTELEVSNNSYKDDTIVLYTIKKGDSLSKIAKMFDISENTIRWANNLKKGETPKEGEKILILPVSGVSYVVKKGDNIKSIAKKFNADPEEVGIFNGLEIDSKLAYGETIIIPNGEVIEPKTTKKTTGTKSKIANVVTSSKYYKAIAGPTALILGFDGNDLGGYFIRPVKGGVRTQGLHGKNAVDIGASSGTSIYSAATGTVLVAKTGGYNGGYGNYVIISHPNGTQTVYAHMKEVYVTSGQNVSQGEQIGTMGSTGLSTGPHLHFEVRGAKNPLSDNPRYGL
jgi:murein DD-endopeptidase MepM/ murein hydrolase activator NlpD